MRRLALLVFVTAAIAAACGGSASATPSAGAGGASSAGPSSPAGNAGTGTESGIGTGGTPAATAPVTPAASLSPGWTLFTPPDRSFSIGFPGKPAHTSSSSVTTLGAMSINAYTVFGSGSRPGYIVTQDRFPATAFSSMAPGDLDRFLEGAVAAYAGSAGTTATHETDLTFLGHPARSATVASGTRVQNVVVFVAGADMYILAVVGPTTSQAATASFFGSFRLP